MSQKHLQELHIPRSVKEEWEEVLRVLELRFPAACGGDHGKVRCAPAAHGGSRSSSDLPGAGAPHTGVWAQRRLWSCGKPTLYQAPDRSCGAVERSPCWSRSAGRTCDPVGSSTQSSLWDGLPLEELMENCLPQEGPHARAGEQCEESFPWGGSSRDNM